jgi:hypothetical protein
VCPFLTAQPQIKEIVMDPTIDLILEKAAQASQALKDQKRAGLIFVLCLDRDRETPLVGYIDGYAEETRAELQQLLDEGARPICLEILPLGKPLFIALAENPTIDDQAIIESQMVQCEGASGAIVVYHHRPEDQ